MAQDWGLDELAFERPEPGFGHGVVPGTTNLSAEPRQAHARRQALLRIAEIEPIGSAQQGPNCVAAAPVKVRGPGELLVHKGEDRP